MCENCNAYKAALNYHEKEYKKLTKQHRELVRKFKKLKEMVDNAAIAMSHDARTNDKRLAANLGMQTYGESVGAIDAYCTAMRYIGYEPPVLVNYTLKSGGSVGRNFRGIRKSWGFLDR